MLINICLVELLRQVTAHIFLFFNIDNVCNFLWIHVNEDCFETCKETNILCFLYIVVTCHVNVFIIFIYSVGENYF